MQPKNEKGAKKIKKNYDFNMVWQIVKDHRRKTFY